MSRRKLERGHDGQGGGSYNEMGNASLKMQYNKQKFETAHATTNTQFWFSYI